MNRVTMHRHPARKRRTVIPAIRLSTLRQRASRVCLAGFAGSIAAQLATTSAVAQVGGGTEIIVTARKREEQALRVPVNASVLTTEDIEREQLSDLYDVASRVPGLVLGTGPLEVGSEISLRGVGSSPLDPAVDQSVALNLDGLPLGQGAAYAVGLFDMARIEVLKGPQPLFFGKNSPGGVIAIRTADPGSQSELTGSTGYEAEAREFRSQLVLSGPVSQSLGLRLAAQYSDTDGFFRNTAIALPASGARQPEDRTGRGKSLYLRLTGIFRPSGEFTARLKLNATHDRILGGAAEQLVHCPDGTFNYLPTIGLDLPSEFSANEDCRADRKVNIVDVDPAAFPGVPNQGVSFTEADQRFGSLELNWDVSPQLRLTSVTGRYHLKVDALQNGPWVGGAAPPLAITKNLRREETTQELRLASQLGGRFDFTAGAFLQHGRVRNDIVFYGNRRYGFPDVAVQGSHDVAIRSYSLFGQGRARPSRWLEIAAGLRWTREKRSDAPVTYDLFGSYSGVPGTPLMLEVPRLRSSNWSPELTISWYPSSNLTIFGALKQAYKSGSYNINQALAPGDDNSFGDERGRGGELGVKALAAHGQLSLDLVGYLYNYSGLQVGITRINSAGLPALATVNAGAARIRGLDLDLRYRPERLSGLSLTGALNWNHGRFTRFANADCKPGQTVSEGCNLLLTRVTNPAELAAGYFTIDPVLGIPVRYNAQDLSGTRLHRAPAWQANAGLDYEASLGGRLALGLGARVQYSSSYVIDLGNRTSGKQEAFAKLGANVRVKDEAGRWEVALIGNNLFDRLTTGGCFTINYPGGGGVFPGIFTGSPIRGPAGAGETLCAFERGRELWLRLTLRPSIH